MSKFHYLAYEIERVHAMDRARLINANRPRGEGAKAFLDILWSDNGVVESLAAMRAAIKAMDGAV